MTAAPDVEPVETPWCRVSGVFWRAVDPEHRERALGGSRLPGRYSTARQPTLYLSSSPEGVAAAMIAHRDARQPELALVGVEVVAERVVDFRDPDACRAAGVEVADAVAPWQAIVDSGGTPPSWGVRNRLDAIGAHGLIDPSRKAPGLWHLALFRWNVPGAPSVTPR